MTPEQIAQAWAQAYSGPAQSTYQAPATTNYGNLSGGVGQDVLSHMQGTQMWDPSGGDGSTGSWGYEGGQPVYGSDPNGNPNPVTYGDRTLAYHPQGQGVGEQYPTFDPKTGEFKGYQTGSKVQSYASGVLSVLGAGLGFGLVGGAAGAAGAAGGGAEAAGTGAGVTGLGDAGTMYAGGTAGDAATLGGGGSFTGAGMGSAYGAGAGAGVTGFGDAGTMYAGNTAQDAATLGGGGSMTPAGGGISLSDALKTASKVYGQMGQQQTAQSQTPIPGLQDNRPSSYVGPAPGYAAIASPPTKSPMLGGLNNPWSPYMVGLMGNRNGY